MDGISFKKPMNLRDLMQGTSFEFVSSSVDNVDDEDFNLFWNEENDVGDYKNPCETSFADWRTAMVKVSDDVFKKVQKRPAQQAKQVDIKRQRIIYHRNMYFEGEEQPFDSTYLNGKTDEICQALDKSKGYLEGFLEALSTMKEGEKSLFVIGYKKMFMEHGCPPRIQPKADVLCELEVVQVEEVGDQEIIDKLSTNEAAKFADIKKSLDEVFVRATENFSKKKFNEAIKGYRRIYQAALYSVVSNAEEEKQRKDVLKRVHINIAVCYNKIGDYKETLIHICSLEELGNIGDQPKALYTKGVALMKMGELKDAVAPLVKALQLKPLDEQIIKAVEELNDRKKKYDEERKAFAKKLGFQ